MTQLTITPKVADKTARFKGTIAAGEHVAVTIKGGAEWIGTDNGANLTLRVLDLVTGRTLAVFPRPEEVLEEDEEADAWVPATDDANDLYCELNLNTTRMVAAARHMLRVPVMFVLGDTDNPRTLYFRDRYEVEYWPERIGDTVPYDLDKWPKQIDEWAEQVSAWAARLGAMKLSAVRTEAEDEDPGKTTITLNDGTAQTDTVVEILDGQVTPEQMGVAIAAMGATKQDTLTFDAIPTEDSDNPVKSGGVYDAVNEVADDVTEHVGNTDIHVLAAQKAAWTAKYDKPQGGIPKGDLAAGVQASLALADTAVQVHQDISGKVDKGELFDGNQIKSSLLPSFVDDVLEYSTLSGFPESGETGKIYVAKDTNKTYRWSGSQYVEIAASPVTSVNGQTGVVVLNIPAAQVNADWNATGGVAQILNKPTIPAPVSVDATLTTQGAAADAKAVGDALRSGFTEWVCDEVTEGYEFVSCKWEKDSVGPDYNWRVRFLNTLLPNPIPMSVAVHGVAKDATSLSETGTTPSFSLSRHLITPTKTSQLTNDGAPNGGGTPYATTAQIPDVTGKADKVSGATAGNLASLDSSGNLADSGVKPSDFAAKDDLPYALVTPGKWEFSEPQGLTNFAVTSIEYDDGDWTLSYTSDETASDTTSSSGSENATSVVFYVGVSGEIVVTATRPSLPGHLCDRAGNRVVVTGATTLTLPAAVPGYLRDFLVRLEISGSTVPTITFQPDGNESVTYETDGDDFPVPDEAGDWLYSFTESCVAHKFAVSLKKVNEVAQAAQ